MKKYNALKKERLPFSWCPGCGINIIATYLAEYFEKNGYNNKNSSILSGIGCSGRFAGYFNMDTMHTTHGRSIPTAEGLKLANEKLNVVVVSGDGDLLSIGLTHTLHAARRNTNIKVICLNNSIFGMTGGQTSPTTKKAQITKTSPQGSDFEDFKIYETICKPYKRFYARVTPLAKDLFFRSLDLSLKQKAFTFTEVVFPCFANDYRRQGYENATEALRTVHNSYKEKGIVKNLRPNQLGIIKNEAR